MDPPVEHAELIKEALRTLAQRCPRLLKACYWAGTSAISVEELGHRPSLDLDFHTLRALADVRPLLAEIQHAFPGAFQMLEEPDEAGSGFRGLLTLPNGHAIPVEARSSYESALPRDVVASSTVPQMKRVALSRYLEDKIQCVVERVEARDLVDIDAVLLQRPDLAPLAERLVRDQDPLLLSERLLSWSEDAIARDLSSHRGVDPARARRARDTMLAWIEGEASR